ncbi:MurR/RpiR family transcriptional regulator [Vagococcus lutrae]|uniref:MurR/RpiR family transcriptional regulator n=1 Tax=Vagococcus lutrae TaxID=81947 RepID=UPI00288E8813|nr:MurR/RpiR family transcriptional regulator [Vagococcus lutrae]MDT2801612.1 MurR/RpiR family transcriptional regulator [Vagococcus lutrae]MDT2841139.1 MurR/RpiR family transcriptional regulator [Vagococcus lutrae]
MEIIGKLQETYSALSIKEKAVASYLLQHPDKIKNTSIKELAKRTETSPATITRLVKKLGMENFVELKLALNAVQTPEQKVVDRTDAVFDYYQKAIHYTREMNTRGMLKQAVHRIMKANRLLVLGIGSSALTAEEFCQRLLRMGLNASAVTDSHFMLISSSIVTTDDLVIGISASGETVEVIESMKTAKEAGARTMSLTCFSKSTLAEISDEGLTAYSSSFIDNRRFINSQFGMMYMIDVLSTQLLEQPILQQNMDRTVQVFSRTKSSH